MVHAAHPAGRDHAAVAEPGERVPESPNFNTTPPEAHRSARIIERRDVDHAPQHCTNSVGGSKRAMRVKVISKSREMVQINVKVISKSLYSVRATRIFCFIVVQPLIVALKISPPLEITCTGGTGGTCGMGGSPP